MVPVSYPHRYVLRESFKRRIFSLSSHGPTYPRLDVLRSSQLDAARLDDELGSMLKDQFMGIFSFFPPVRNGGIALFFFVILSMSNQIHVSCRVPYRSFIQNWLPCWTFSSFISAYGREDLSRGWL